MPTNISWKLNLEIQSTTGQDVVLEIIVGRTAT